MEGLIEGTLSIGYCAFPVLCPEPSPQQYKEDPVLFGGVGCST